MIKRVYVAGPLTADPIEYLANMRSMYKTSKDLILAGYSPFCPALDYQFFLALDDNEQISLEAIQKYSLSWLTASDAILVIGKWVYSTGTLREMNLAVDRSIPIFRSIKAIDLGRENTMMKDYCVKIWKTLTTKDTSLILGGRL